MKHTFFDDDSPISRLASCKDPEAVIDALAYTHSEEDSDNDLSTMIDIGIDMVKEAQRRNVNIYSFSICAPNGEDYQTRVYVLAKSATYIRNQLKALPDDLGDCERCGEPATGTRGEGDGEESLCGDCQARHDSGEDKHE